MKNADAYRNDIESLLKTLKEAKEYVRQMIEKKKSFFGKIDLYFSTSEYKEKI